MFLGSVAVPINVAVPQPCFFKVAIFLVGAHVIFKEIFVVRAGAEEGEAGLEGGRHLRWRGGETELADKER